VWKLCKLDEVARHVRGSGFLAEFFANASAPNATTLRYSELEEGRVEAVVENEVTSGGTHSL
jgi:hypothetical protein